MGLFIGTCYDNETQVGKYYILKDFARPINRKKKTRFQHLIPDKRLHHAEHDSLRAHRHPDHLPRVVGKGNLQTSLPDGPDRAHLSRRRCSHSVRTGNFNQILPSLLI